MDKIDITKLIVNRYKDHTPEKLYIQNLKAAVCISTLSMMKEYQDYLKEKYPDLYEEE